MEINVIRRTKMVDLILIETCAMLGTSDSTDNIKEVWKPLENTKKIVLWMNKILFKPKQWKCLTRVFDSKQTTFTRIYKTPLIKQTKSGNINEYKEIDVSSIVNMLAIASIINTYTYNSWVYLGSRFVWQRLGVGWLCSACPGSGSDSKLACNVSQ